MTAHYAHDPRSTSSQEPASDASAPEERREAGDPRFREVFGLLSDYAYSARIFPDGRVEREWTTGNMEQVTGYTAEEFDRRGGLDGLLHPDDAAAYERWKKALEEGQAASAELRVRAPDGTYRWISNRALTERDADGHAVRVIGSSTNITPRREAEQLLREQTDLLRTVTENTTAALFMMDARGHCTYMNPAAEEMTGYVLDEIRDRTLHEAIHYLHPDGTPYPSDACPLDRALPEARTVRNREDVFIRKNGAFFPVVCSAEPILQDGVPVGTVIEVRDVTEEKQASDALLRATREVSDMAAHRSAVLEQTMDGVILTDADGAIVFINEVALRVHGRGRLGVKPDGYAEAFGVLTMEDEPFPTDALPLARAVRHGETVENVLWKVRQAEGRVVVIQGSATPIRAQDGRQIGAMLTLRDVTESRRMEEALRESEARARLAIEAARLGTWRYDPQTGRVDLDEQMCVLWNQSTSRPQLTLAETLDHIYPDDRPRVEAAVASAVGPDSDGHYTIEYRVGEPGRPLRWLAANGQAQFEGEGKERHAVSFTGTAVDITERKVAEVALRRSEARTRALLQAVPDVVLVYPLRDGEVGTLVEISDVAVQTYGYTREELLSMRVSDLLMPGSVDLPRAMSRLQHEGRVRFETVHRARDGREIPMETVSQYFALDGEGTVLSIARDITERKMAEAALRQSEARFRHLAEALPDIVYSMDGDGAVEYLNGRWFAYTGQSAEVLPPNLSSEIVHPEDVERFQKTSAQHMPEGLPFEGELRLRRHDGIYRWFLTRVVPVRDAAGRTVRWFGTSTDIHAQKALEVELESRVAKRTAELGRANQTLEARNRELQEFAYVASHDLQEPLRKIRTFADLLVADYGSALDDEARHFIERMQDAAARMSSLIIDLLAFSRVSTRGQAFVPVDLNAVMQSVLSDLEVAVEETGATIEVTPLPVVEADPTQMRQLVQNLVGNALKYRRDDVAPHVRVEGTLEPGGAPDAVPLVRLVVEDNGIGFEEKYAERIFTPFQRLHGRGRYTGTGIGLAICRKIVERHGGTIAARSVVDRGSTFVVTLPVLQPDIEGEGGDVYD